MSLNVNILTPTQVLVKDLKAKDVGLITDNGQIEILKDHTTLLGRITPGIIRIALSAENAVKEFFATVGFLKVENNTLLILADVAESAEKIDLARAEKAKKEAEEKLKDLKSLTTEDLLKYERKFLRAKLRIMVAHSRKH